MKLLGLRVSNNVKIFKNVDFGSEPFLINIGKFSVITSGCRFITHDGSYSVVRNLDKSSNEYFNTIVIGDNVFIGLNSIILPGVKIGNNVIIGAGSVVTKSIPDNSVVAGNPAKILTSINEFMAKHRFLHSTKNMKPRKKIAYLKSFFESNPKKN